MPVTGLIEQAPRNAYYMSDALGGDIIFRTLCNNNWIFGDGSNTTSTLRINKNMISTTAGTFTHAGILGVSNLNPQYTLDVGGDINFTGILRQNGSAYVGSQWSNNSNMVFLMNSNVGIGTSNPQFNLHVPGTIATSNLRVNNITGTGSTINIGTDSNTSTINIGGTNSTVNLIGSLSYITATDLTVADKRMTLNKNGGSATAGDAGIEIEEGGSIRAYIKTSTDRNSFLFKTPNGSNDFTMNLTNNAANFNNNLFVLNSNSCVGVNTNNPGYTFDVSGVINASSNILINGQALQAGYWVSTGTAINWTQSNVTIGTSSNPTGMRLYLAGTGTTNTGGTGDMTNITSNLLTLYDTNYPRIVYRSGNASISTTYNYESNKSVYWGETADTGYYSFRGRGLSVGYTTIPGSNYNLDINGTANIADKLFVTNNIGIGTTNTSEKVTIAAGNVALVHAGAYGNNGSSDKWVSIGDRTQTLAPQFQQSNYGITMTWDTDGCFFGLRDFGTNRKDTVISFGDDSTDNLRFMFSNSADYMTITGTGNVGIGRSNPSYRLDINGDINFTGTLRSNGTPFIGGGGGVGFSNNSSNLFVIGSNVGIGTSTPQRALHVVGDVQFDSNIYIANNTNIATRGLMISKRNAGQSSTSITSLVTSVPGYTYTSNVVIQPASACNIQLLSSNVGVGCSNPSYALDVFGDINFTGALLSNGTPFVSGSGGVGWSNYSSNIFVTGCNVGIGTSTPQRALHVVGDVQFDSNIYIANNTNISMRGIYISKRNSGQSSTSITSLVTSVPGYTYNSNVVIQSVSTCNIQLLSSNVGIGRSNPAYALDVLGDINFSGTFRQNGTPYVGSQWSNSGANVFITGSNVGIGTTTPGYALDVAGDINFTGAFRQNGTQYVGSQWSNNSSNIFINNSNVAIGKTSPSYPLDVNGTVAATSFIENGVALSSKYLQSSGGNMLGASNVYAGSNDSSNLPGHSWTNDTGTGMYRPSLCNIGLATGGIERFRMTSNGNIGINRTVPGFLLDVNGSLNGVTIFENSSPLTTKYAQSNTLSNFALSNQLSNYALSNTLATYSNFANTQFAPSNAIANASTFRWNSSNAFITGCNVGINTNTPQRALHVSGDIQVDSNLLLGGVIGVQGLQINRRTGGVANVISSPSGYSWNSNITLTPATGSNIILSGTKVGFNTTTPATLMSLTGTTQSMSGPHTTVTTSADANTVFQQLNWQHDNISLGFDIAFNGTNFQSMNATTTNFQIYKFGSKMLFNWASNAAVGSNLTMATALCVNSNGSIGIGTTSPTQALEVNGSMRVGNNATNNKLIVLFDNGTGDAVATACNFFGFGINSGTLRYQVGANTNNHVFYQANTATMLVGSNIGVGTTTPAYKLDVSGDINFTGTLRQNGTAFSSGGGGWTTGSGTVYSTCNVGIGTSTPTTKLDVNGTSRLLSQNAGRRWPPIAFSSNSSNVQTVSSQAYGNGTYYLSQSATDANSSSVWAVFNNSLGGESFAITFSPSGYNGANYVYTGTSFTTVGGSSNYYGGWIQIQMPTSVNPASYTLGTRANGESPDSFSLLGSTDGTFWNLMDRRVSVGSNLNQPGVYTTYTITNPGSYSYFRIVIDKSFNSTYSGLSEWYFTESRDASLSIGSNINITSPQVNVNAPVSVNGDINLTGTLFRTPTILSRALSGTQSIPNMTETYFNLGSNVSINSYGNTNISFSSGTFTYTGTQTAVAQISYYVVYSPTGMTSTCSMSTWIKKVTPNSIDVGWATTYPAINDNPRYTGSGTLVLNTNDTFRLATWHNNGSAVTATQAYIQIVIL